MFVRRFNPQNPVSFSFSSKQRNPYADVVTWHHGGRCTHTCFQSDPPVGPSHREWRENVNIPREKTRADTASTAQIQSQSTGMEKVLNAVKYPNPLA